MNVVVVESPAKAKTIEKYLGPDFTVLASFGHVRDLPAKDGSVRPDENFAMDWEADDRGARQLREIGQSLKGAQRLILATDPDREGEAISWHVREALAAKGALKSVAVERVTFNAITKSAVTEAMARPRAIDMPLVEAYLARRALDYLVGFTLSPVLWRKLPGARSAGRVQSVALRLVCERELEIEKFRPQDYWTIAVDALSAAGAPFLARVVAFDGKKLGKLDIASAAEADRIVAAIRAGTFSIAEVESKPVKRNPPPPFITSSLQQEAARKFGFAASRTMQIAQKLYEGVNLGGETVGLITYMRTDGVQMAEEAIHASRRVIGAEFGERYLSEKPRRYASKAKNAQEAHEAIRPTDFARLPDRLRLEPDMAKLYDLIWKRAIASQMEAAAFERTTAEIPSADGKVALRATGQVLRFDGFLRVYREDRDDQAPEDEDEARLPPLAKGEAVKIAKATPEKHTTEPPPRYSEASLVKKMEELGIGRPSTYASILSVLRERNYVRVDRNRFIPEDKGRLVIAFLENFFARYVQYDFTAGLEEQLDKVSAGDLFWKDLLEEFWRAFRAAIDDTADLRISEVLEALTQSLAPHIFPEREDGANPRACPTCGTGLLSLKTGKFGAFIGCSNYPECRFTRQLGQSEEAAAAAADRDLGLDPQSGESVWLKSGRFGPYVQLGGGDKPKRASLPKGWSPSDINLERALRLLNLPREVGPHPEDGAQILAGIGRFGPYVQHGKAYANLSSVEDVFEIGLNRAVSVLADKASGASGPRRGRTGAPAPLAELGAHPQSGKALKVMAGRYGPYITDGETNATLPKGADPASVSLTDAAALIDARAATAPAKKKKTAAKRAKSSTAAEPAAKKPKAAPKTAPKTAAKTAPAVKSVKSTKAPKPAPAKAKASASETKTAKPRKSKTG